MSSVSNLNQLVTVPFHGNKLFIVEYNNEPYTPMKPIVEGMGLDWGTQYRKLAGNIKRWGIVKMTIPTMGDLQEAICLPLRKIFGWLMTISPNKVKPELKPTVEQYQNECDEVLWQYWNNKLKTNSDQRTPLRQACDRLAVSNMLTSDAYKIVWEQYGVNDIDQIPLDKLAEATAFVYEMILRLQKSQALNPNEKMTIELIESVMRQNTELQNVYDGLRYFNQKDFLRWSNLIVKTNTIADNLSRKLFHAPKLDELNKRIVFSNGEVTSGIKLNWFNYPA